jgi:hypothetical protein
MKCFRPFAIPNNTRNAKERKLFLFVARRSVSLQNSESRIASSRLPVTQIFVVDNQSVLCFTEGHRDLDFPFS